MSAHLPTIHSAGILIIGDEVLNGKILDTNSHEFAKFCFQKLSVPLKRTVVCGDDEQDIVDSLKTLKDCSFVITSGGIGSTHDDITYSAIAKAYNLDCRLDQETVDRMQNLRGEYLQHLKKDQLSAFYRMATIPQPSIDSKTAVEKIFISDDLWVPVVGVDQRVYILPGVPQLFKKLLTGLLPYLKPRVQETAAFERYFVKTTTKENELAPFLSGLQERCDAEFGKQAVKLGSYPHYTWQINTISIISGIETGALRKIVDEIVAGIGGNAKEISAQEEDRLTTEDPPQ
ncbi:hypothetical protein CAAN1_32S00694 [[Candida] anglica]|uniref:MoaB/Mog domain-containing protein n=1 Tax=[Candida] anglica TaxID=148631 RepID=A0ABP0EF17_9ASCO